MGLFNNFKNKNIVEKLKKNIEETLNKPVSEIMSKYVISIQKSETLMDAGDIIVGEKVSCVVVKDGDLPVGVVTERDFLKKAPLDKKKLDKMKVSYLMSPKLMTITPETTVKEAIPILVKNNFRKLVVMKDNYMTGIVTQTDFVRLFNKLYESLEIKTSDLLDVNKVMTKKVLTISKGSKFSEAKNRMAKNNVGSIIVTNKKKIVGIITEYDIAAEIVENTNKCQSSSVDSIMISPVLTIYGDTNIFEANKLMVIDNVRRLPIVEDDELKGIITQTDICRAIFYFLKATYWHMDQKTLKWEKLEKVEAKKTLI